MDDCIVTRAATAGYILGAVPDYENWKHEDRWFEIGFHGPTAIAVRCSAMRRTKHRIFLLLVLFCLAAWISLTFFRRSVDDEIIDCSMSAAVYDHIKDLAAKTHEQLQRLNIPHFLCYGSLWGQIRREDLFPWKRSVEFCAMNSNISRYDELYLARMFKQKGLTLSYDSQYGYYTATGDPIAAGSVFIYVFEPVFETSNHRRIGWKHRILPPTAEGGDPFPKWIVAPTLPVKRFMGLDLPVPREGIEILKYHYPTTWWQEVVPKACRPKKQNLA